MIKTVKVKKQLRLDELIKANETMAAVNAQSNADVEEARTYK